MQSIVPARPEDNPNGHTEDEIRAALVGATGGRRWSFRYELQDGTGRFLEWLDGVESCTIEQNWLALGAKRTARFRLRDLGRVNYLSDRIRPWVRLHLPPYGEQDWVQWPQGVFLLASPARRADAAGRVMREVEAYDLLQVLADDRPVTRQVLPLATSPIARVLALLGSLPTTINDRIGYVSPVIRDWEPGTSKLGMINDLLDYVNWTSLAIDEQGRAVSAPYVSPGDRPAEYTYAADHQGLIIPEVDQQLDLFAIPNQWTLVVSEPDRPPLSATYTNNNPSSPTSTVRRGRTITDYRTEGIDAIDLTTLEAKVTRLAQEASQVYEVIEFSTGLMPIHSGNDCYRIVYPDLAINAKYVEHWWSMELRAGAPMHHRARRVVTL